MLNKEFLNFAVLMLNKDKSNHIFSAVLFMFIVFILSAVLFISNSIQNDMLLTLDSQAQIIVKNQKAGKHTQITDEYLDEIIQINGIENIEGKIEGYYYFAQDDRYFHIFGNDDTPFDKVTIGEGVKDILDKFYYKEYFNFITDDKILKVFIDKTIPKEANIISNDIMILNTQKASMVLGLDENEYSYLQITIPKDSEIDFIANKIKFIYPHLKIETKEQLQSNIKHLFYYKGGLFMILYIVVLLSFFILLKNQIDNTIGTSRKDIAILRAIGYSINNIILLKFIQNIIISLGSYTIGVVGAYIYVFKLDAPLLKYLFLGSEISNNISFTPTINFEILFLIFIFTIIPFLSAVILPSWKIAISDINEAMR